MQPICVNMKSQIGYFRKVKQKTHKKCRDNTHGVVSGK